MLGSQVISQYVECYPWKAETNFGSDLQTDVEVPLSGTVRRKITYRKDERVLIRPNAKALFLIAQDYVEDFQRYIDTIQEITGLLGDAKVFSLGRGLYKSQMQNRLRRIKWLRERYKT